MKGVITIDFDDTLACLSDEKQGLLWCVMDVLEPNQKILDFVHEKVKEGYVIDIVTARDSWAIQEVRDFIEQHNVPIRKVHHTAGAIKTPILKQIGSVLHIDDALHHVIDAEINGIECLLVDDGRHKNNCTAEQFNKILI
jgi:hypothetical protein